MGDLETTSNPSGDKIKLVAEAVNLLVEEKNKVMGDILTASTQEEENKIIQEAILSALGMSSLFKDFIKEGVLSTDDFKVPPDASTEENIEEEERN